MLALPIGIKAKAFPRKKLIDYEKEKGGIPHYEDVLRPNYLRWQILHQQQILCWNFMKELKLLNKVDL